MYIKTGSDKAVCKSSAFLSYPFQAATGKLMVIKIETRQLMVINVETRQLMVINMETRHLVVINIKTRPLMIINVETGNELMVINMEPMKQVNEAAYI